MNTQPNLQPLQVESDKEVRRVGPTNRGLAQLNPDGSSHEDIVSQIRGREPRSQYAPMKAHQELASMVIATGGTYRMAARYAGVNRRQIHKYMQDPDFRARIDEHRAKLVSGIKGRILGELGRRTKGSNIKNWEIMDLVRVLDRLTGTGGKGMTTIIEGDVNVTNNKYEAILAALYATDETPQSQQSSDSEEDGSDFPRFLHLGDGLPRDGSSEPSPV